MAAYAITASELVTSLGADAETCHRRWTGAETTAKPNDRSVRCELPALPAPWQTADPTLALAGSILGRLSVPLSDASRRWGPGKLGVVVGTAGWGPGETTSGDDLIELVRRYARARGPAYAVTGDIVASGWAIRSAVDLLGSGLCDGVVVVAVSGRIESRAAFWEDRGELGRDDSRPLASDRSGLLPGEGAAVVLLERQGRSDVELRGWASASDATAAIVSALDQAGTSARALTWALCGADGRIDADRKMTEAICGTLGAALPLTSAVDHRGSLGAAQDVAALVDVVRSVEAGWIGPLWAGKPSDGSFPLGSVVEASAIETDLALTLHAGVDGAFTAFVVGAREP